MKTKIYFLFLIISFNSLNLIGQSDTTWYSKSYQNCVKEKATYYRLQFPESNGYYRIKQYFLNGELHFTGVSKDKHKEAYDGELNIYNSKGKHIKTLFYENNKLLWQKSFDGKRVYETTYKEDKPYSGKIFQGINQIYSVEYKEGKIINEIRYYLKSKKKREVSNYENGVIKSRVYYNQKGEKIGQSNFYNNLVKEGEVIYFHDGKDEHVFQIHHYKNFDNLYTDYYYHNGKPKSILTKNPLTQSFFSTSGALLGRLTFKGSLNNKIKNDGTWIVFGTTKQKRDHIVSKEEYKNGKIQKYQSFHDNGKLQLEKLHNPSGYGLLKEISFDKQGDTIAELNYKNQEPWNGFRIKKGKETWYENGALVKEYQYFPKSDTIFSKRDKRTVSYYNKQNELIGQLTLKNDKAYYSPLSGVKVTYYNKLFSFYHYKNGSLLKSKTFTQNYTTKKVFKELNEYDPKNHYTLNKSTKYYSNGKIKSETWHESTYTKLKSIFYDMEGNNIGEYDYKQKTGTLITFFSTSDQIKKIEKKENDVNYYIKKYLRNTSFTEDKKEAFYLFYEIDKNKEAIYYSKQGSPLFKVKFKDKLPFEGAFFDVENYTVTNYKNGKKDGVFTKYLNYDFPEIILETGQYVNNLKEGEFKQFKDGFLIKTTSYKNGQFHGKSKFYNKNGEVVSELSYQNNKPYDGVDESTNKKSFYEKGKLLRLLSIDDYKGNLEEIYMTDSTRYIQYYPEKSTKKLVYVINKNKELNGLVTRYDKNGKITNKAWFKNGYFSSGSIYLKNKQNYYKKDYVILYKDGNEIKIEIYQKDGEKTFEAKEYDVDNTSYLKKRFKYDPLNISYKDLL
ncbi:MAG: hypothetical protein ACPGSD_04485 [Flavobacteriales bacterium]